MSLSRSKPLQRKAPLRRTRIKKRIKKRLPKRLKRRSEFAPYVRWVRSLPCISCSKDGPSDAAHMPVGPRGMGLKASDSSVVPLCRSCHLWFDGHTERPPTKFYRAHLAAKWVHDTQTAATPGDNYDHALELQELGLGEVLHVKQEGEVRWVWKGLVTP